MISRRVFIRNGGLALVSLGFAPSFLSRTVEAAGTALGTLTADGRLINVTGSPVSGSRSSGASLNDWRTSNWRGLGDRVS